MSPKSVSRNYARVWLSRVLSVHSTIPRPNAFAVRLSCGSVMQLRVRQQAANNRSSGSVRRTGRSLRSGRAYDSRAARQRGQESDTQFTDRKYCYSVQRTATRSIHIKTPVPSIQVGILRTQDHWSFHHKTPQRPGHSLGRYTCPVTTMPQQIYPTSNLAAEPLPEAAHW